MVWLDQRSISGIPAVHQRGNISTLSGSSLKVVDKFTYLGSSVSSSKTDINTWLTKAWTAIDSLSVKWKSDLTDKMKRSFLQAVVVSILQLGIPYVDANWTYREKAWRQFHRNMWPIWNKAWSQHPTMPQLYGHLPPTTKSIQVRRTRHAGHC